MARIIPILSAEDSRLTATLTYFSGDPPWHGFDDSSSTYFNSTVAFSAGYITWLGSESLRATSIQFTAQSGFPERLPCDMRIDGTTDGETWEEIVTFSGVIDETEHAISSSNYYTGFRFYVPTWGPSSGGYCTFAECVFLGDTGATTVNCDVLRQLVKSVSVPVDTIRQLITSASYAFDTVRNLVIKPENIEKITIDLQSGVFADQYAMTALYDIPLQTAYYAQIYGWPINYIVNAKSFTPATRRYSISGNYHTTEAIKKYIDCSRIIDAASVMRSVASQLGKQININIDNHNIKPLGQLTTFTQALEHLFSWTFNVPHMAVNVYQRGNTINVLQRGKESDSYQPLTYNIKSLSSKILSTLMDPSPNASPVITGDDPGEDIEDPGSENYNGTFTFMSSSVTYFNGLCTRVVIDSTDGVTIIENVYNDKLLVSTTTDFQATDYKNKTYRAADFIYGDYDGAKYLRKKIETLSTVTRSGNFRITAETHTYYTPLGFDRFGTETFDYNAKYDKDGAYLGLEFSRSQSSVSEGRPGGETSPWSIAGAPRSLVSPARYISTSRNSIGDMHIPVTDITTMQRYADGLQWLNGKTEETLIIDCYDNHVVDFDKKIIVMDKTWYLQSNQITIGPGKTAQQALTLVRWQ